MNFRLLSVSAAVLSLVAACGGGESTPPVELGAANSACANIALPAAMAVGEVRVIPAGDRNCIRATATASDYAVIPFNTDTAKTVSVTLTGDSITTPPLASILAPSAGMRSVVALDGAAAPDLAFHRRLLKTGGMLAGRIPSAQARIAARTAGVSRTMIPANPVVGAIVNLNVNGIGDCTTIDVRATRIVAVGSKSIVLADTANPTGGFTTADYQRFATSFDTLVYPLDVNAFGTPADLDGNGRVAILFTRAVNELTPRGSGSFVGGFFADRDLFPKVGATVDDNCGGSNEAEMFYMLAPDPAGVVNGNVRTTALVDDLVYSTLAHEFQHLINASRRIYVNKGATAFEDVWLNEGLSHVAEELLYYRQTGKAPRQNLNDASLGASSSIEFTRFRQDQSQNMIRFSRYLENPAANSPDIDNDSLATRGATWAFLRYATDRLFTTDGDTWFKLANSTVTGLRTLRLAYGNDPVGLMRDWTVANYTDDLGITSDAKYLQPSWNYRDIFTKTFNNGRYPLKVTGLTNGASSTVSIKQNSAAYYRLSAPADRDVQVRAATAGAAPNPALQLAIVRTR